VVLDQQNQELDSERLHVGIVALLLSAQSQRAELERDARGVRVLGDLATKIQQRDEARVVLGRQARQLTAQLLDIRVGCTRSNARVSNIAFFQRARWRSRSF